MREVCVENLATLGVKTLSAKVVPHKPQRPILHGAGEGAMSGWRDHVGRRAVGRCGHGGRTPQCGQQDEAGDEQTASAAGERYVTAVADSHAGNFACPPRAVNRGNLTTGHNGSPDRANPPTWPSFPARTMKSIAPTASAGCARRCLAPMTA